MSASATTLAQLPLLWARHKQLEAYANLASVQLAATLGASSDGMRSLRQLVARLGPNGESGRAVLDGRLSPQRWVASAQVVWDGITEQLRQGDKDAVSAARVWDELVLPSAADFAAGAKDVAQGVRDGFLPTLALVVVGLVAWAVLRVTR